MTEDTTGDKVANARKSIGAGVSAAFAAAIPLVGVALTDGVVTGQEAGGVAAAFAGALVSVAYVTWQTVNKPKPSEQEALGKLIATAAAVSAPIVLTEAPPISELVGGMQGNFVSEEDATPVPDGYQSKHTA
jgi:drug/metabolite transporter superfamily protein YnfA